MVMVTWKGLRKWRAAVQKAAVQKAAVQKAAAALQAWNGTLMRMTSGSDLGAEGLAEEGLAEGLARDWHRSQSRSPAAAFQVLFFYQTTFLPPFATERRLPVPVTSNGDEADPLDYGSRRIASASGIIEPGLHHVLVGTTSWSRFGH